MGVPALVHHYSAPMVQGNSVDSLICRLPFAVPSGCLVVVETNNAHEATNNVPTITDDIGGNTYTAGPSDDNNNQVLSAFYCPNVTNGPRVFTATWSTNAKPYAQMWVTVYMNCATSSPIAASNHGHGTGTAMQPGAIDPGAGVDGCLFHVTAVQDATLATVGNFVPGTNFTPLAFDRQDGMASEYWVQTTSASLNPTLTQDASRSWLCIGMAIKPGTSGSTTGNPIKRSQLMNCTDSGDAAFQAQIDGDLAVLFWNGSGERDLTAISDSLGDTWVERGASAESTGSGACQVWDVENPTAGLHVLTMTSVAGSMVGTTVEVHDIRGATASAYDGEAHSTGTHVSGTVAGATFAVNQANTLLLGLYGTASQSITAVSPGNFFSPGTSPDIATNPDGENNGRVAIISPNADDIQFTWTYSAAGGNGRAEKIVGYKLAASALSATLGQPSETDLAQAISHVKTKSIGQNTETDLAQALTRVKSRTLGQVTETDTPQAITHTKIKAIGQNTETDLAQAMAVKKTKAIGQVTESDTAQPFSGAGNHSISIGQVSETDLAQAFTHQKYRSISIVTEADIAQAMGRLKKKSIGQCSETNLAQAINHGLVRDLAQVSELDFAQVMLYSKKKTIGMAAEFDLARPITPSGVTVTVLTHRISLMKPIQRMRLT